MLGTITTVVVTAGTLVNVAKKITDIIKDINAIKQNLISLRDTEIQAVWKSQENVDSQTFCQRMQELEKDVNDMIQTLDEYVQLLERSAKEYERTQNETNARASALKSPTNR